MRPCVSEKIVSRSSSPGSLRNDPYPRGDGDDQQQEPGQCRLVLHEFSFGDEHHDDRDDEANSEPGKVAEDTDRSVADFIEDDKDRQQRGNQRDQDERERDTGGRRRVLRLFSGTGLIRFRRRPDPVDHPGQDQVIHDEDHEEEQVRTEPVHDPGESPAAGLRQHPAKVNGYPRHGKREHEEQDQCGPEERCIGILIREQAVHPEDRDDNAVQDKHRVEEGKVPGNVLYDVLRQPDAVDVIGCEHRRCVRVAEVEEKVRDGNADRDCCRDDRILDTDEQRRETEEQERYPCLPPERLLLPGLFNRAEVCLQLRKGICRTFFTEWRYHGPAPSRPGESSPRLCAPAGSPHPPAASRRGTLPCR